jgi:hypothetical protein
VITRAANDSSAPTNAEVSALLGRNPVAGDICTVSYNLANNAVVYRFVTSWALFQTYITGSLIVQNTITGDKVAANTITGTNIAATTITAANIAANTITASQIAAATISAANMAANSITAANAAIADAAITSAKIGDLQVNTLQIANNAVSFIAANTASGSGANATVAMNPGDKLFVNAFINQSNIFYPSASPSTWTRQVTLSVSGAVTATLTTYSVRADADAAASGGAQYGTQSIPYEYTAGVSGNFTFTVSYNTVGSNTGATSIFLIGLKK